MLKNLPVNAGEAREMGGTPGSGRSLGTGNGNPLQYSCLENSKDRGAWRVTVNGVAKSRTHRENEREMGLIISLKSCILSPNQHLNQAIKYLQYSR